MKILNLKRNNLNKYNMNLGDNYMKYKQFLFDILLNIISTAIPIAILQLVVLPNIALILGNERYGTIITLISLFTLVSNTLGNSLNNLRLLQNNEYNKNNYEGDFNIILFFNIIVCVIVVFIGSFMYEDKNTFINVIFLLLISCLDLLCNYLKVTFRIVLNYKAIILNNIFTSIGYLLGYALFYLIGYWQIIYIMGFACSLLHILKNSSLLKEKYIKTPFFKQTLYKDFILVVSGLTRTVIAYADKLILYPLLGPTAVSIYYSATILGKLVTMTITSITSVMLSYLSRMKSFSLRKYAYIFSLTCFIGILSYFGCIYVSKRLLVILYPQWAAESLELIYITTATVVVSAISNILHPIILRFFNLNWQLVLGFLNLFIYITCGLLFFDAYGLIGFCIGLLVSNVIKLLMLLSVIILGSRYKSKVT